MADKTKKATVTKKTAPKEFEYERLPYEDSPKLKPMPEDDITLAPEKTAANKMQGKPFKLGSNREMNSYSAFQAKGLINPIQNKKGEEEMKEGYRGKSNSQKAKELKKQKQDSKRAAELTFTTRLKESGLSLDEYKKTKEGGKLAADIQRRAAEIQGY